LLKRVVWCIAILTMIAGLVSGCKSEAGSPLSEKDAAVKIGYYSEAGYIERYGDKLEQSYPNLTYSVIPTVELMNGKQDPRTWAEENQVDVIYVPGAYISDFIASDLIINLDALIKMHKFDLSAYYPGVIDYLRTLGQGSVYAIPPAMSGNVLVYNKQMLEEKGLAFPDESPTWEQVLELAAAFPGQGLAVPWASADRLALKMGEGSGLALYKNDPVEVNVASKEWQALWQAAAETLRNASVLYGVSDIDPFMSGECALAVLSSRDYDALMLASMPFDYGFSSMPIGTGNVRRATDMTADGYLAIASSTKSTEAAFELLQLFLSPALNEWNNTLDLGVPTLQESSPEPFAKALYALEPTSSAELPEPFYKYGAEAMQQLVDEPGAIKDILQNMEQELEAELRK
jgi:multiple sugar transport system substrate-binding protein